MDEILWWSGIDGAEGYYVRQTNDGGYIICGAIDSLGTAHLDMRDLLLIRTDSIGNQIFAKAFNRMRSEAGVCVQQTTDNGFIICGSTMDVDNANEEIYVIKTDDLGNVIAAVHEMDLPEENIHVYPNPANTLINFWLP